MLVLLAGGRARADVQVTADVIAGGGVRLAADRTVRAFGSGSLYVDALIGPYASHWNAPRLGPFASVRLDVGAAWRSASVSGGLSVLVLGRREESHLFRAGALVISFGAGWHLDQDDRAQTSRGHLAADLGVTWGFRLSRSFAFPTLALFAHYHWVFDTVAGDQHDFVVGIQFSVATPFGAALLPAARE